MMVTEVLGKGEMPTDGHAGSGVQDRVRLAGQAEGLRRARARGAAAGGVERVDAADRGERVGALERTASWDKLPGSADDAQDAEECRRRSPDRRGERRRCFPKYERMRELRAVDVGAGAAARASCARSRPPGRARSRSSTRCRATRSSGARAPCADGDDEPWMAWSVRYHELMRAALAIRARRDADAGARRRGVRRARRSGRAHGRLNVVVFAAARPRVRRARARNLGCAFPAARQAPRDYRR